MLLLVTIERDVTKLDLGKLGMLIRFCKIYVDFHEGSQNWMAISS